MNIWKLAFRNNLIVACGALASTISARAIAAVPTGTPPSSPTPKDKPDGRPVSIRLTDGGFVSLTGFKVNTKQNLSAAQCGVVIDRQRIITMGTDETEVYTCGTLVAAGILPPDAGDNG